MGDFTGTMELSVRFFDGERESYQGTVTLHQYLSVKDIETLIRDLIGLPWEDKISLYIISPRKSKGSDSRKVSLTEKTLPSLFYDKNCHIRADLKRAKRDKARKPRAQQKLLFEEDFEQSLHKRFSVAPPQKMLLRRDPTQAQQQFAMLSQLSHYNNQATSLDSAFQGLGFVDHAANLRNLLAQRENYNYLMSNSYLETDGRGGGVGGDGNHRYGMTVCEICSKANGREEVPFHGCVNDPPIRIFRSSPAGPIQRPNKKKG